MPSGRVRKNRKRARVAAKNKNNEAVVVAPEVSKPIIKEPKDLKTPLKAKQKSAKKAN